MTAARRRRAQRHPLPVGTRVEVLRPRPLAPGSLVSAEAGDVATIVRARASTYVVELSGVAMAVLHRDVAPVGSVV